MLRSQGLFGRLSLLRLAGGGGRGRAAMWIGGGAGTGGRGGGQDPAAWGRLGLSHPDKGAARSHLNLG